MAFGSRGNSQAEQLVDGSPAAWPSGRNAGACRSVGRRHGPHDLRVVRCCFRRSTGQGMLRWLAFGPACATLHGHGSMVFRRPALGLDGRRRRINWSRGAPQNDLRVGTLAPVDWRLYGTGRSTFGSDGLRSLITGRTAHAAQPSGWEAERWMTTRPGRAALLGLRTAREALSGQWITTRAPGAKLEGGAPMATSGRGVEGECPGEDEIPGEYRAPPPATRWWRRNGLVPGSKALKSTPRRRLRLARVAANHVVARRRGERNRRPVAVDVSFGTRRRRSGSTTGGQRALRGVTAPDEGNTLKGKELHERSGMKQGRVVCRGVSRHEGAKPWRRNVPGEASPG